MDHRTRAGKRGKRVSEEERNRFFAALDEQVKATRADAHAWAEEEAERAVLSGTLLDGLSED